VTNVWFILTVSLTCLWNILTCLGCPLACLEIQLMIIIQPFECVNWLCRPNLYRDRHHNHDFSIFCSIVIYIYIYITPRHVVKIWHLYCVHWLCRPDIFRNRHQNRVVVMFHVIVISEGKVWKRIHMRYHEKMVIHTALSRKDGVVSLKCA
jgi:hypothetical protein